MIAGVSSTARSLPDNSARAGHKLEARCGAAAAGRIRLVLACSHQLANVLQEVTRSATVLRQQCRFLKLMMSTMPTLLVTYAGLKTSPKQEHCLPHSASIVECSDSYKQACCSSAVHENRCWMVVLDTTCEGIYPLPSIDISCDSISTPLD